uniref:Uncharacterized protein n=1 Tax=Biomphalaria glabrata TaxID=6526 RepID=A0A2C9M3T0_BIOGL
CIIFLLLTGHHEQQISEGGEADLYNLLNDCYKNPDHANFIPVKSFRIEHLPPSYRNEDLYEFIKAAADLTVKVSVTLTSPERPEFWPNTNIPYFLFSMRGSKHLRTGSGNVINVRKEMKKCPCEKCKISEKPNNIWWTVIVRTAASVIFDSLEAGHSVFRFFYDTEDSPEVVLKGVEYHLFKNISKDWCLFDCVTCDEKLVDKLNSMVKHYNYLSKKVNDKYKHTRDVDKIMFIVSHPHGCSKQLSLGQWKNKVKFKVDFNMLTYLTATCPGSSGACVHCLGYGAYVHCGSLASGHNYSNETISLLE